MRKIKHLKHSNNIKLTLSSALRFAGWSSLGLLGLIGILAISPTVTTGASAEEFTAQATQELSVWAHPVISISVNPNIDLDVIPTSVSKLSTISSQIKVTTNNSSGYGIFLGMQGNSNDLISDDASNSAKITAIASPNAFANNTWGYNIAKGTTAGNVFSAVPITATKLPEASTTTGAVDATDIYTLTFGTQIDTTLPAGSYSNSVVISAVANPIEITSLAGLTYMQSMNHTICENTRENYTKRLIDTRDGKSYWVAKLADGNCWMTQNLALDLREGQVLTPADTDVNESWTVPTTTETSVPGKKGFDFSETPNGTNYTHRSWNLGEYVIAAPLKNTTCNNPITSSESTDNDGYNSLRPGDTFARCSDFQNVSGWQATFEAQNGTWKGEDTGYKGESEGLVAANPDAHTYDAHYLVGNYYQYNAAVAGGFSPEATAKEEITTSICPAGWRLPSSGNIGTGEGTEIVTTAFIDVNGSFYNLIKEYGYPNSKGYNWNDGKGSYTPFIKGSSSDNYQDNLSAPSLYMAMIGRVNSYVGSLRNAANQQYYWSSTAAGKSTAYVLFFSPSQIAPANALNTHNGISIRCLAR